MVKELSDLLETCIVFTAGFIIGLTKYVGWEYKIRKQALASIAKGSAIAFALLYARSQEEAWPGYAQNILIGLAGEHIGSGLGHKLWGKKFDLLPDAKKTGVGPFTAMYFDRGPIK